MPKVLPKKFKFSHEFSFFLHDTLAHIVVEGEKRRIFEVPITFKSQIDANEFRSLSGEQLWDWLENNGYESVNIELSYKQIIVALLSDFCQFIYEALKCSEKGKLVVTYTLLRKPLKDNLFYLEWLLADPKEFLQKFLKEGPSSIALSMANTISKEKRLEIIKLAISKTHEPDWVSADFIYDLRYNKGVEYSFEGVWNQAAHLVTTVKHYATEEKNFNFVFSNKDDRLDQWEHIYSLLPLLLYHTILIIEALVDTIVVRDDTEMEWARIRRTVGFQLWSYHTQIGDKNSSLAEIQDFLSPLDLKCPNCARTIRFGHRNLRSFYLYGNFSCSACHTRVSLY